MVNKTAMRAHLAAFEDFLYHNAELIVYLEQLSQHLDRANTAALTAQALHNQLLTELDEMHDRERAREREGEPIPMAARRHGTGGPR